MTEPSPETATTSARHGRSEIRFAHASEAEFARILDFYDVRWMYEPEVFPILWDLDGNVVESFTPDFYLPEFDMFVEMTTLQQRLVRKKNRKVRRLRELYPFISIKLFYARDFRALMLKYGRVGLVDELSGAVGQASAESAPFVQRVPSTSVIGALARSSGHGETVTPPDRGTPGGAPYAGRSRAARRRAARRSAIGSSSQIDPR